MIHLNLQMKTKANETKNEYHLKTTNSMLFMVYAKLQGLVRIK